MKDGNLLVFIFVLNRVQFESTCDIVPSQGYTTTNLLNVHPFLHEI